MRPRHLETVHARASADPAARGRAAAVGTASSALATAVGAHGRLVAERHHERRTAHARDSCDVVDDQDLQLHSGRLQWAMAGSSFIVPACLAICRTLQRRFDKVVTTRRGAACSCNGIKAATPLSPAMKTANRPLPDTAVSSDPEPAAARAAPVGCGGGAHLRVPRCCQACARSGCWCCRLLLRARCRCWPLVGLLAMRLHDGGPALYWQQRVGRDGRRVRVPEVPLDAHACGGREPCRCSQASNQHGAQGADLQDEAAIRASRRSAGSCAAPASTSCPSCGACCAATMSLVGPRPALAQRGRALRACRIDERLAGDAGADLHLAGQWAFRGAVPAAARRWTWTTSASRLGCGPM